jgi:FemAB-related protein (PEP-CTERM system-associated)
MITATRSKLQLRTLAFSRERLPLWRGLAERVDSPAWHDDPRCLGAICDGLRHKGYMIEASQNGRVVGCLPLALVESWLFGRYLVSLPYVSSGGVLAEEPDHGHALVDEAVRLANELDVRHLELRHESECPHPALTEQLTSKVHMRLALPETAEELWQSFKPKVRNQIRKGEKQELLVEWGRDGLLTDFYDVFSRNMRDLGTPVFDRRLFRCILEYFPDEAEFCVVRLERRPIAAALLVHGRHGTEVPSASSLRRYNATNANMLMYWELLKRSIGRGQQTFDFGRSSAQSNTYRFKKQWGAEPHAAIWQYYRRRGDVRDTRIESGKYNRLISIWQKLPLPVTRLIGPRIVRGIP